MDLYIYDVFTVPPVSTTDKVVTTSMGISQHLALVTYLFSTLFTTSTTSASTSTNKHVHTQPDFKYPRISTKYTRNYYSTTSTPRIQSKWYNEQDYWRNIVSRELAFHLQTTDVAQMTNRLKFTSTSSNPFKIEQGHIVDFLYSQCCMKTSSSMISFTVTVPSILMNISTEHYSFQSSSLSTFEAMQIIMCVLLTIILLILVCFALKMLHAKRKRNRENFIQRKEACEMSSFKTRMRRHHVDRDCYNLDRDSDTMNDLLRSTQEGDKTFVSISLKDRNFLRNENCRVTTLADVHRSDSIV
jgi:uncharacterized membrane protein